MFMYAILFTSVVLAKAHWYPRIWNGEDANIEDFPYQVSLLVDGKHFCGGSILSPTRILTATHCINYYPVSKFILRAGSSIREEGGQVRTVVAKFPHPDWDERTANNDVGVLVLSEPLELNDAVQTIDLAETDFVPVGGYATVTGWGITENNTLSTVLQQLQIPKIDDAVCKNFQNVDIKTMVCYGEEAGITPCRTDSGGPVVYEGLQVGIVSFSTDGECSQNAASVFARVENFYEFIISHLN